MRQLLRGFCMVAMTIAATGLALQPALAADIFVTADITVSETWTPDNEYILTQPIYVTNGATLTILPGTVIRGEPESAPGANDPGTLIVSRDSKINAVGTRTQPIIFTDLDDDNIGGNPGTFPYDNLRDALDLNAQWGGVILLGRGWVAKDTALGPNPSREVQIEGLTTDGGKGLYGNCAAVHPGDPLADPAFCDNDDSGAMKYVSIRYGGFNLSSANEINGLTMGAVGRNTNLEYIEVFQNKDDAIEFFGGAAQIKHFVLANVGDDSIDYDEGWRGKGQYVFVMQGIPGTGADKSDKGGEHDGGNSPDDSQPFAIPTFYNVTMIGHGQKVLDGGGQTRNTALHMRDNAGGRYYNSFWGDFSGASVLIEGDGSAGTASERATTAYTVDNAFYFPPASTYQLELEDNDFWCIGRQEDSGTTPLSLCTTGCTTWGADNKPHYDNGMLSNAALGNGYHACSADLPIRALVKEDLALDPAVPDQTVSIDPRPTDTSPLWTTDRVVPQDGFFEPAPYKGAFGDDNWAEGWTVMSRLGYFPDKPQVPVTADITTSETWTADNEYVLTQPIYVTDGATLTIEPCTVIRSEPESAPGANDPGTLIISRDSKINAVGREDCPIVFTDLDDDNIGGNPGTFPYDNLRDALDLNAQWGGVILLGRGWVAKDTALGPNPSREVQIEGLTTDGGKGLYGNCAAVHPGDPLADPAFCDNDDSGAMRYVSIRYGGFNLSSANEINGLTMGAVGRNTDLEYIEVFQNKDDAIEFFGGAAQIKHFVLANVGDDSIDYDEGWRGKGQYVFVQQGIPGTGADKSDKGGEHDGGNSPDDSQPFAIPTFYNVTMIGHGQKVLDGGGQTRNTALHMRDNAGGRYYNSFWGDFSGASVLIEGDGSAGTASERATTAYTVDNAFYFPPASTYQLELEDNDFWCIGRQEDSGTTPLSLCTTGCTTWGADNKPHYDNGMLSTPALANTYYACSTANPIRTLVKEDLAFDPAVPDQTVTIDPRPVAASPLWTTARTTATDGFFEPAPYKGAFQGKNWASCWTTMYRLGYFPACDAATAPESFPDEVINLRFPGKYQMVWDGLCFNNPGGYDVLRSTDPSDFSTADFVEEGDHDTVATDGDPASGVVFYYSVRGNNTCGSGPLGYDSNGAERPAP